MDRGLEKGDHLTKRSCLILLYHAPDIGDHDTEEYVPLPILPRPGLEEPLEDLCFLPCCELL